jgi:hypothetical protein
LRRAVLHDRGSSDGRGGKVTDGFLPEFKLMPAKGGGYRRKCSIAGCVKIACNMRGWCCGHYNRWISHGDPLGGGTSMGEARSFFEDVVLAYEGDNCLVWPFARDKKGYAIINYGRRRLVSRLVCDRTKGPAPSAKHAAAHSCGKGREGCVTKGHLSWKTATENKADELIHGTRLRGEKIANAKLTSDQVRSIRSLKGKFTHQEIADRFGVSRTRITTIFSGRNWGWLK